MKIAYVKVNGRLVKGEVKFVNQYVLGIENENGTVKVPRKNEVKGTFRLGGARVRA